MVNYSLGKIYKIEPITGGEVYIGSTSLPLLSTRMANHRSGYKRWKGGKGKKTTSYDLFEKYGVENCQILLLENVNATNKDELAAREGHWINSQKCVNKYIAGRTQREWLDDNKEQIKILKQQWNANNIENIKQYKSQYNESNKESIKTYNKQYRETNKEVRAAYNKQYRETNKEAIAARNKANYEKKSK